MLDSVQGVEGGLKFDPTTGGLVAAGGSIIPDFDNSSLFPTKNLSFKNPSPVVSLDVASSVVPLPSFIDVQNSIVKLEDECYKGEYNKSNISTRNDAKFAAFDARLPSQLDNDSASLGYFFSSEGCKQQGGLSEVGGLMKQENVDPHIVSWSSSSMGVTDEMDATMNNENRLDGDDEAIEHNQPTSSGMTDSSNGSMMNGSSSSSQSFSERKNLKTEADGGLKLTVKATYNDDTIRFKFDPSAGCLQLYEEVAKRFKLQAGTFQLKYLDDEEEWVMLVTDSDLQECLEILEFLGTRNVKFLVREAPFSLGSSGSSNFLTGGS